MSVERMVNIRVVAVCLGMGSLSQQCASFVFPSDRQDSNMLSSSALSPSNRRDFLDESRIVAAVLVPMICMPSTPSVAAAASDKPVVIKVSPVSHTFITSSGSAATKPIRENDATRYFTNARVVFLLEGKNAVPGKLAAEIVDLTTQRKADCGAGVTPGNVQQLKGGPAKAVADAAKAMPEGDVLLVGPISSTGTAGDGKLLADTAAALGTFVGGKKGGGVISVLLDGPKENIQFEESGYPTSDLFWFSLP